MLKRKRNKGLLRRLYRGRRGQAMASYAIITAFILGSLVTMSMVILPKMLDAYDAFTESLYFCINSPIP
jgi:hypothetical protein